MSTSSKNIFNQAKNKKYIINPSISIEKGILIIKKLNLFLYSLKIPCMRYFIEKYIEEISSIDCCSFNISIICSNSHNPSLLENTMKAFQIICPSIKTTIQISDFDQNDVFDDEHSDSFLDTYFIENVSFTWQPGDMLISKKIIDSSSSI